MDCFDSTSHLTSICNEKAEKPRILVEFIKDQTKQQKIEKFIENERDLARYQGPLINLDEYESVLKAHFARFPCTESRMDSRLKCQRQMLKMMKKMMREKMITDLCLAKKEAMKENARKQARVQRATQFAGLRCNDDSDDDDTTDCFGYNPF